MADQTKPPSDPGEDSPRATPSAGATRKSGRGRQRRRRQRNAVKGGPPQPGSEVRAGVPQNPLGLERDALAKAAARALGETLGVRPERTDQAVPNLLNVLFGRVADAVRESVGPARADAMGSTSAELRAAQETADPNLDSASNPQDTPGPAAGQSSSVGGAAPGVAPGVDADYLRTHGTELIHGLFGVLTQALDSAVNAAPAGGSPSSGQGSLDTSAISGKLQQLLSPLLQAATNATNATVSDLPARRGEAQPASALSPGDVDASVSAEDELQQPEPEAEARVPDSNQNP